MKTYKQRTDDIVNKAQKQKALRKKITLAAVVSCACAAFVAINCVLFIPYKVEPAPSLKEYENSEYYPVIKQLNAQRATKNQNKYKNNFEKWSDGVNNFLEGIFSLGLGGGFKDKANGNVDVDMMPPTAGNDWDENLDYESESGLGPDSGEYVETTDNQVAGVIEGDLFKRTEEYIYYLTPYRYDAGEEYGHSLQVFSIAKEESALIGTYGILGEGQAELGAAAEMYLSADCDTLTVVSTAYRDGEHRERYTSVIALDVSDPANVREIDRKYVRGEYISSRLVNGKLLLVNSYTVDGAAADFDDPSSYVPQYGDWDALSCVKGADILCPETLSSTSYAVISEIDQTSLEFIDCEAFLSYSNQIYVSEDNIFLTRRYMGVSEADDGEYEEYNGNNYYSFWADMTEIVCVSYTDGGLERKGSFSVEGQVRNQYSMDEYAGMLRVVTTNYSSGKPSNASLYCVELTDFETVGKVERFCPDGEEVQSVRFDGTKAYVCTAEIITLTDPVYVFDLTDPQNIPHVDTGVIEGYSTSLVNFKDGYLLGIGYGKSMDILKIEIYKETKTEVECVCAFEKQTTFSTDYKSYFIDRKNGLVGLGVSGWSDGQREDAYLLLSFNGESLEILVEAGVTGDNSHKRATIIDGYIYILGGFDLHVEKVFETSGV